MFHFPAYLLFSDAHRAEVKKAVEARAVASGQPLEGRAVQQAVVKELGVRWQAATDEEKAPLEAEAARLKAEFETKKAEYEAKKKSGAADGAGAGAGTFNLRFPNVGAIAALLLVLLVVGVLGVAQLLPYSLIVCFASGAGAGAAQEPQLGSSKKREHDDEDDEDAAAPVVAAPAAKKKKRKRDPGQPKRPHTGPFSYLIPPPPEKVRRRKCLGVVLLTIGNSTVPFFQRTCCSLTLTARR